MRDRTSVLPSAGRATECKLTPEDMRGSGSCQQINKLHYSYSTVGLWPRRGEGQKAKLIKYDFHFVIMLFHDARSQVMKEQSYIWLEYQTGGFRKSLSLRLQHIAFKVGV